MLAVSTLSPFASFLLIALHNGRTVYASDGGNVLNELSSCWDSCSQQTSGTDCSWYETNCKHPFSHIETWKPAVTRLVDSTESLLIFASQSGICKLANDTPYLADTITCAKQICDHFSTNQVDRFLAPIEFSCSLMSGIQQSRLNDAQAAAEASSNSDSGSHTQQAPSPTHHASTMHTTLKATTTNSKGSTAVVEQPLQYGPSGVSSGEKSTSIVTSVVSIIPVPASGSSSKWPKGAESTTTAGGLAVAGGTPTPSGDGFGSSATATATGSSQTGGGGTLFDSEGGAEALMSGKNAALLGAAGLISLIFVIAL